MKLFLCFTFLYQITFLLAHLPNKNTLQFSQVIFRHGDRNPRRTYGNYSQNFKKFWPEGKEQLTDLGKKQAYELGQFLRKIYEGFLSPSYNGKEISIISSHIHRCIKTASSCVLGTYKNFNDAATWTTNQKGLPPYEPIPIRTIPDKYDNFLSLDASCPKREKSRTTPWSTFFEQRFYKNEPDFLEYVFQKSGQTALFENPPNSTKIHQEYFAVHEVINCLRFADKPLEDWMLPLITSELFLSYTLHLQLEEYTENLEKQRLNAGSLVQLMLDNFAAHLNGTLDKKIILFSAHDKNLVNVMFAFDIIPILQNRIPPYASSLLIELHKLPEYDDPVIEFWYKKGNSNTLVSAESTSCGIPCTLKNLIRLTSGLMNVNYETECILH